MTGTTTRDGLNSRVPQVFSPADLASLARARNAREGGVTQVARTDVTRPE